MLIRPVYCHFSFRRLKGKEYSIFACACYGDKESKELLEKNVEIHKLWLDHQHVTAVQSYWFALKCLYDWQNKFLDLGITNILLVCNNSNLVNAIAKPKKSGFVADYLEDVYRHYVNGDKSFELPIGICEAVTRDKSVKFCREDLVTNFDDYAVETTLENSNSIAKLDFGDSEFSSVDEILEKDGVISSDIESDSEDRTVTLDWSV